ncbi:MULTISPECIES: helix-turn-helix domain-containing protein [Bacillus]|uniref:helix-turn-helix domain-containing protein n=1 Tax=Bacillus TaxID=1386 RepID=UPI00119E1A04|nr:MULTISPECIES: helix-turn-helix transcriptional regulator [Bacillus]MDX9635989.1 helix-turn-helix transcriptional regulator [Bacillus sp. PBL-C9]
MTQFYLDVEKLRRREGNITLERLAEKVGIHKGNLSRMARGNPVNLATINKIANALKIEDINEIVSFKKSK